ncbi:MAG: DUF1343 domain-containing protein [Thermodesulfovibrionales bacterium]
MFRNCTVGLLAHPASVDRSLRHAVDRFLASKKFRLAALFGPQHGFRGETQDNMIEWGGYRDPVTGLAVYSLYGETRKPRPEMLQGLDLMVVDLQDVGSRYYTFIWTLALVIEACQEQSIPVLVLDRPNPITGSATEGPVLDPAYASFVGLRPLPVRHAMTIAEIALYLKDNYYPALDLHLIPMDGWRRAMWFDQTGLPWVLPSPNMPTLDTAVVYPGMCLLEGTNLSEGRGTTRPFEIFGAPFIEPEKLVQRLGAFRLPGVVFRTLHFLPTFQKHSGSLCGGSQIHVTDRKRFRPFLTAAAVLKAVIELWPAKFAWKQPPYEYEEKLLPIDILAGTDRLRKDLEQGRSLKEMEAWWAAEADRFRKSISNNYKIYK